MQTRSWSRNYRGRREAESRDAWPSTIHRDTVEEPGRDTAGDATSFTHAELKHNTWLFHQIKGNRDIKTTRRSSAQLAAGA